MPINLRCDVWSLYHGLFLSFFLSFWDTCVCQQTKFCLMNEGSGRALLRPPHHLQQQGVPARYLFLLKSRVLIAPPPALFFPSSYFFPLVFLLPSTR